MCGPCSHPGLSPRSGQVFKGRQIPVSGSGSSLLPGQNAGPKNGKGVGLCIIQTPATISSWIKQTVVLCYDLSDQDSLTLHQVKAHDVRAFAASKAFQGGISLDQILAACHWKSHNTFTQFYLKDVVWADKELFHLGPVVAAQQIHH